VFIVLTTVASEKTGLELAGGLVREGIAACVQIHPRMTSVYMWKGEIEKEGEHLLLIKTDAEKWPEVEGRDRERG
jgi:periplasmic divalent cation tolerance protein